VFQVILIATKRVDMKSVENKETDKYTLIIDRTG